MVDDKIHVTREIDGGLQTIAVQKPAIITTDLRLNEPRYASLPNIMKAKSKPISEMSILDFNINISPRFETINVAEPPKRTAGILVKTVDEFIVELKKLGAIN
jgi:electron transfer flavoprotein beta subunit